MKRSLFWSSVLVMCALCVQQSAATIFTKIVKKDGRDNGLGNDATYNSVVETRVAVLYTLIECSDPGAAICPSGVVGPNRSADQHTAVEQAGVDYALSQIRIGVLSGNTTVSVPGNPNNKRLKWTADNANGANSTIKCWVFGDPEP